MKSRTVVVTWLLSAALPLWGAGPESAQAPAPTAKKVPHMQKLHGDELVDPYLLDARAGEPGGPGISREGERLRRRRS